MRSNPILRVTVVVLSLGVSSALAAQPTFDLKDNNNNLSPAHTSSAGTGLALIANTINSKTPKGYSARTGLETTQSALGRRLEGIGRPRTWAAESNFCRGAAHGCSRQRARPYQGFPQPSVH